MSTVEPGVYRHYKGGTYTVLFSAKHHETDAELVVYVSHTTGGIRVRPVLGTEQDPDGWLTRPAEGDGFRFTRIDPPEPVDIPEVREMMMGVSLHELLAVVKRCTCVYRRDPSCPRHGGDPIEP